MANCSFSRAAFAFSRKRQKADEPKLVRPLLIRLVGYAHALHSKHRKKCTAIPSMHNGCSGKTAHRCAETQKPVHIPRQTTPLWDYFFKQNPRHSKDCLWGKADRWEYISQNSKALAQAINLFSRLSYYIGILPACQEDHR